MIYTDIIRKKNLSKQFALLIDPSKHNEESLHESAKAAASFQVDFILIGGSLVSGFVDRDIEIIRSEAKIPIIIFPGSLLQISNKADAILLLSLISGRNPEYLIGNHVIAAPVLKNSNLEVIPTGYLLIENGTTSSVEYISNTKPIPPGKTDLVIATALAGEMLGLRLIYLEGGSGSMEPINEFLIKKVKSSISVPLIVGGGIHSTSDLLKVYNAGADIAVVGNALENDLNSLQALVEVRNSLNSSHA
jgi:putative glycerol-1-phosphate prenyltransferase